MNQKLPNWLAISTSSCHYHDQIAGRLGLYWIQASPAYLSNASCILIRKGHGRKINYKPLIPLSDVCLESIEYGW
jgi:hypothetical protein